MIKVTIEGDKEDVKRKILDIVNVISIVLFILSAIGFSVSMFLKHIPFIVVSLVLLTTAVYVWNSVRKEKDN